MSVSEAEAAVKAPEKPAAPPAEKAAPAAPVVPVVAAAPFVDTAKADPEAAEKEEKSELDALLPEPSEVFPLANGTKVRIKPLKMRELLKLLRIITRGGTALLPTLRFNNNSPEQFAIQFVTVVAFAIPEAEDFAVDFVQSVTVPADLQEGDTEAIKKFNEQQRVELFIYLDNPELEDLLQVIEQLVHREKNNLQSLGKRLGQMFKLAERMGQLPPNLSQGS